MIVSIFAVIAPATIADDPLRAGFSDGMETVPPDAVYKMGDPINYTIRLRNPGMYNVTVDIWDILPNGTIIQYPGNPAYFPADSAPIWWTFSSVVKADWDSDHDCKFTNTLRIVGTDDNPNIPGGDDIDCTWTRSSLLTKEKIFNTGEGAYPSISGMHKGTITPNQTIDISILYTYPCPGTGGHTEYAAISYPNGTLIAEAHWHGYVGDWHNITFNKSFTLYADETYNYSIKTGSYPQIYHSSALPAENGWINCTSFEDANGKRHEDWIPAIKLWSE